jgi:hypothetical protein
LEDPGQQGNKFKPPQAFFAEIAVRAPFNDRLTRFGPINTDIQKRTDGYAEKKKNEYIHTDT